MQFPLQLKEFLKYKNKYLQKRPQKYFHFHNVHNYNVRNLDLIYLPKEYHQSRLLGINTLIIRSEKKTGGLFKSDYVAYTVTTGD